MNNSNRNTRTLIVSFLIAVFALIPLRFIEVGQQQDYLVPTQVLGEKTEEKVEEVPENVSGLESPYDEMEKCSNPEELEAMENEVYVSYGEGYINEEEVEALLVEIENKKSNICQ